MRSSAKPGDYVEYHTTGSQQDVADTIAAQDAARANQPIATHASSWAPWIIGGLVVAGAAWWLTRD